MIVVGHNPQNDQVFDAAKGEFLAELKRQLSHGSNQNPPPR